MVLWKESQRRSSDPLDHVQMLSGTTKTMKQLSPRANSAIARSPADPTPTATIAAKIE